MLPEHHTVSGVEKMEKKKNGALISLTVICAALETFWKSTTTVTVAYCSTNNESHVGPGAIACINNIRWGKCGQVLVMVLIILAWKDEWKWLQICYNETLD